MLDRENLTFIRAVQGAKMVYPHCDVRLAAWYVSRILGRTAPSALWLKYALIRSTHIAPIRPPGRPRRQDATHGEDIAIVAIHLLDKWPTWPKDRAVNYARRLLGFDRNTPTRESMHKRLKTLLTMLPTDKEQRRLNACFVAAKHKVDLTKLPDRPPRNRN